jgi:hypothetical protein
MDDFIPPASGAGPVLSDPAHPYVPNGNGRQPTYRIADLTNPILKPWVIEKMKKANDDVMAGKVPYIARERCWPAGVPALAQALQSRDPEVRLKATEVLGRMGEDAKDAVPELVRLLDDPDLAVRKAAARTIGRIGPAAKDAVPALMRSLLQTAPQPPTTPAAPAP